MIILLLSPDLAIDSDSSEERQGKKERRLSAIISEIEQFQFMAAFEKRKEN